MKTFLCVTLILACGFCLAAQEAKTNSAPRPQVMSVIIGGAFGRSYEISYDRRELRYYAAKNMFELTAEKPMLIKPTEEQWRAFLEELKRLNVWSWKRSYDDPNVADGTYWRAVVSYASIEPRDLFSSGSNAYPPNFKEFLAAIQKLIGDREFQ